MEVRSQLFRIYWMFIFWVILVTAVLSGVVVVDDVD